MTLHELLARVTDKSNFKSLDDYSDFCFEYLGYVFDNLQAVIVSQNETQYRFFQYNEEGAFNVTRPINNSLMFSVNDFDAAKRQFAESLSNIKNIKKNIPARKNLNRFVYTCQQAIGATLDALPAGESNKARKINGDLFERYIRNLITEIGINVREGTVRVPVIIKGKEMFKMAYQHDLIVEKDGDLRAIGSVKTSSKDRVDKIFIDKFLYNHLTNADTPHFAVFLNDVQRKGIEPNYGINTTFLTGHFKGYTIKLNPLDGVYYCDLRPIMQTDSLLKKSIRRLDYLLVEDIWNFVK